MPTVDDVKIHYPSYGSGIMYLNMHCKLTRTGRLAGCVPTKVVPDSLATRKAGLFLASRMAADVNNLSPLIDLQGIDVAIRFSDGKRYDYERCVSPRCIPGPPPLSAPTSKIDG